jgi:hypothetical protein
VAAAVRSLTVEIVMDGSMELSLKQTKEFHQDLTHRVEKLNFGSLSLEKKKLLKIWNKNKNKRFQAK